MDVFQNHLHLDFGVRVFLEIEGGSRHVYCSAVKYRVQSYLYITCLVSEYCGL